MLGIQMFKDRCTELNFSGAVRLHNSNNVSILGVDIWRRAMEPARPTPPKDSLPRSTMASNELCREFGGQFRDHNSNPLTRANANSTPPPLSAAERKRRRVVRLRNLGLEEDGVGASVQVRDKGALHEFLTARSGVSREDRVTITRWQCGLVVGHQPCRECGQELSREHAIDCAAIDVLLAESADASPPTRGSAERK